jgi:hypothetical protein
MWRAEFPVEDGTTLREFFLLVKDGEAPLPEAIPFYLGGRCFRFFREEEGAAGSFYESLYYWLRLLNGEWLALVFVIHTVNPGVYIDPPCPYDRERVMSWVYAVLRGIVLVPHAPGGMRGRDGICLQ